MRESTTTLLAVAITMSVTATLVHRCVTPLRCPHGAFHSDRAGSWTFTLKRIPERFAHDGKGDVFSCKCIKCRGAWWYVIAHRLPARAA